MATTRSGPRLRGHLTRIYQDERFSEDDDRTVHVTVHRSSPGLAAEWGARDLATIRFGAHEDWGGGIGSASSKARWPSQLRPRHVVIAAGTEAGYQNNLSNWAGKFPHPLVTQTLNVLDDSLTTHLTGQAGNLIFKCGGGFSPRGVSSFTERADEAAFAAALQASWT